MTRPTNPLTTARTPLREVGHIFLGITLRGADASRHDPKGTHQLIRIGDLSPSGVIRPSEVNRIRLEPATAHKYSLTRGDILLAARGSRLNAGLFDSDQPSVAGGQFLVVRPKQHVIIPSYLLWFLNLPSTQKLLESRAGGTYMRSLSISTVAELGIPRPDLTQQQAVAQLQVLRIREHELIYRTSELRETFLDQSLRCALHL